MEEKMEERGQFRFNREARLTNSTCDRAEASALGPILPLPFFSTLLQVFQERGQELPTNSFYISETLWCSSDPAKPVLGHTDQGKQLDSHVIIRLGMFPRGQNSLRYSDAKQHLVYKPHSQCLFHSLPHPTHCSTCFSHAQSVRNKPLTLSPPPSHWLRADEA